MLVCCPAHAHAESMGACLEDSEIARALKLGRDGMGRLMGESERTVFTVRSAIVSCMRVAGRPSLDEYRAVPSAMIAFFLLGSPLFADTCTARAHSRDRLHLQVPLDGCSVSDTAGNDERERGRERERERERKKERRS
jgi:hypothetical protein